MPRIGRIARSPVLLGGAAGLAAGFTVAAVLIAAGEPWHTRGAQAWHWPIYWLDFPAGNAISPFAEWRWSEGMRSRWMLLSTALNGLFWGLAGTALARGFRQSARLRRTVAIEIPLIVALGITGVPSPFAGPMPLATAAAAAHTPAFVLLTAVGLCCGYVSHFRLLAILSG